MLRTKEEIEAMTGMKINDYESFSATPGSGWIVGGKIQVGANAPNTEDDPLGLIGSEAAQFAPERRGDAIEWLRDRGCPGSVAADLFDLALTGTFSASYAMDADCRLEVRRV